MKKTDNNKILSCSDCSCSAKNCSKCDHTKKKYCRKCCWNGCEFNCGCKISKGEKCRRFCRWLKSSSK